MLVAERHATLDRLENRLIVEKSKLKQAKMQLGVLEQRPATPILINKQRELVNKLTADVRETERLIDEAKIS
jgi:hypothetical protein